MWPVSITCKIGYLCANQVINVHSITSILFDKEQKCVLVKCININKNEQNKDKIWEGIKKNTFILPILCNSNQTADDVSCLNGTLN